MKLHGTRYLHTCTYDKSKIRLQVADPNVHVCSLLPGNQILISKYLARRGVEQWIRMATDYNYYMYVVHVVHDMAHVVHALYY